MALLTMMPRTCSLFMAVTLLGLYDDVIAQGTNASPTTCTVDGKIFQRGESLEGAFESRCGPWEEYPCFCNPGLFDVTPPFVECPYCGYATSTPGLLRCATDRQEITFIALETKTGQRCSCDATDGSDTQSSCVEDRSVEECRIPLDDGSIGVYQPGEVIRKSSRCGSIAAFSCFCNPNVAGQIECPYCAFATPDEGLKCLQVGETETFVALGGDERTCDCSPASPSPSFPFETSCEDLLRPVVGPQVQCTFRNPQNGVLVTAEDGASLAGSDFAFLQDQLSPCGSAEEWPCFCNINLPGQVDCPYCTVPQADGSVVCARDEAQFQVPVENDPLDRFTTCFCNTGAQAQISCQILNEPACTVRLNDGQIQRFAVGDAIPDLDGPCGTADDFPYICDPPSGFVESVVAIADGGSRLEYPYCIFDAEQEGTKACAKDGSEVVFVNTQGVSTTCECQFLSATVGANPTCFETPGATASPTVAPPVDVNILSGAPNLGARPGLSSCLFSILLGAIYEIL